METRIFEIQIVAGARCEVQGGQVTKFDDLRKDGWQPLHWDNISPSNDVIRYRVVMEMGPEHDTSEFSFSRARNI